MPTHIDHSPRISVILRGDVEEATSTQLHRRGCLDSVIKPATAPHSTRIGPDGALIFSIRFDVDILPINQYHWKNDSALTRLLLRFHAEATHSPMVNSDLLEQIMSHASDYPQSDDPPMWMSSLEETLRTIAQRGGSIQQAAEACGVHPVHFSRACRQHLGTTPSHLVRQYRVQLATRLIARGRQPLSEIAYDAGFCDQAHMCRVFRKITGVSPTQYQESIR
ncbi:MAG: helix-turn-helix domain-containing protein [Phycisphaerales bacterium JB043]